MDVRIGLWRKLRAQELMFELWCWRRLESSLDCKEIPPVHSKGDQSWVFIGRTDAKAETPILLATLCEELTLWKRPWCRRDWGQEEKGTPEDEMAGWHHQLSGREFEWTPGVGDGQGGLVCCDSWGRKESDTTEGLTWAEIIRENEFQKKIGYFTTTQGPGYLIRGCWR